MTLRQLRSVRRGLADEIRMLQGRGDRAWNRKEIKNYIHLVRLIDKKKEVYKKLKNYLFSLHYGLSGG